MRGRQEKQGQPDDSERVVAHMSEIIPHKADQTSVVGDKCGIPEIHAHESHRRYKLIDLDQSEIERTTSELFEGSKLFDNRQLWIANFSATIGRVKAWCVEHNESLQKALVDVRSKKVLFYFVTQSEQYDLSLGAAMTELEVELAGSAGIGYVETLQVPARSLDRFAGERSLVLWNRAAAE